MCSKETRISSGTLEIPITQNLTGVFGGGGHPTLLDVSKKFWKLVDVFFRGYLFEIFEIYLPTPPQKPNLLHLFNKYPKNFKKVLKNFEISKKVLKNFSRRFFCPPLIDGPPKVALKFKPFIPFSSKNSLGICLI